MRNNPMLKAYFPYLIMIATAVFCLSKTTEASASEQKSSTGEIYSSESFRDDFNDENIDTSVWQIATWNEHGGQTGTERCYAKDGFLNLVFINDPRKGFLSSAIQTRKEFLYGRWEARLKVTDVPGVLNSLYTIDWNDTSNGSSDSNGTKQEIDIEFLTKSFSKSAGAVHLAVHAAGRKSFDTNPDIRLGFNPSDDFHVWGFEITPEYIEWFVDDKILLKYTYKDHNIAITAPYQLKLNVWSQNGASTWIGGPPAVGKKCIYQIDWIKFTPFKAVKN